MKKYLVCIIALIGISLIYGCEKGQFKQEKNVQEEENLTEKEYYQKYIAPTLNRIIEDYSNVATSKDVNGYGNLAEKPVNTMEEVEGTFQDLYDLLNGWMKEIDELKEKKGTFTEKNQKLLEEYSSFLKSSLNNRLIVTEILIELVKKEQYDMDQVQKAQELVYISEMEYHNAMHSKYQLEANLGIEEE